MANEPVLPCIMCGAPDPWRDWREKALSEQAKRRALEGRVRHLEAVLNKVATLAFRAGRGDSSHGDE